MNKIRNQSIIDSSLDRLEEVGIQRLELLKKGSIYNLLENELSRRLKDEPAVDSKEMQSLCGKAFKEFKVLLERHITKSEDNFRSNVRKESISTSANSLEEDGFFVIQAD